MSNGIPRCSSARPPYFTLIRTRLMCIELASRYQGPQEIRLCRNLDGRMLIVKFAGHSFYVATSSNTGTPPTVQPATPYVAEGKLGGLDTIKLAGIAWKSSLGLKARRPRREGSRTPKCGRTT